MDGMDKFGNISIPLMPGLEPMSSDKYPHFTTIESVSRTTKFHRHRRQVIAGQMYEWQSSEIPYQIWGGDFNFQSLIRRGIRMWEESTCLRFRENLQSTDAIRYVLERGTAVSQRHALGFWHTHQRPDREKHISINWRNVLEEATASFMPFRSMLQAFGIKQVSNRKNPYDYGSLMHYHAVAHAIKVSDFTIVPKELKYVTTMGTERMAFLDAKVINDIYCPNACNGLQQLRCPEVWVVLSVVNYNLQIVEVNYKPMTNGRLSGVLRERCAVLLENINNRRQSCYLMVEQPDFLCGSSVKHKQLESRNGRNKFQWIHLIHSPKLTGHPQRAFC
uniref:Metalloendopeptidase n=1 Tax=Ditylenchus dipsaci TaxID=166011 RepID=A0A915D5M2_9BILA